MQESGPGELRPWHDDDLDWWVGLRLAHDPSRTADGLAQMARGEVAAFEHRRVAVSLGRRVGYSHLVEPPGQQMLATLVIVEPDAQGRGVGRALFADLLAVVGGRSVVGFMPDGDPRALAVVRHWGYDVVSHGISSEVALGGPHDGPPAPEGTSVRVLDDSDVEASAIDLEDLLLRSDTSPEVVELGWILSLDDFRRMFPGLLWVVVTVDGAPAAVASGVAEGEGRWLVVYTGVLPAMRGRGLARLAKEHLHAAASQRGATVVWTMNEERNTAIRALNDSLGYRRINGETRLRRPGADDVAEASAGTAV